MPSSEGSTSPQNDSADPTYVHQDKSADMAIARMMGVYPSQVPKTSGTTEEWKRLEQVIQAARERAEAKQPAPGEGWVTYSAMRQDSDAQSEVARMMGADPDSLPELKGTKEDWAFLERDVRAARERSEKADLRTGSEAPANPASREVALDRAKTSTGDAYAPSPSDPATHARPVTATPPPVVKRTTGLR